jgi:hypothetical protein
MTRSPQTTGGTWDGRITVHSLDCACGTRVPCVCSPRVVCCAGLLLVSQFLRPCEMLLHRQQYQCRVARSDPRALCACCRHFAMPLRDPAPSTRRTGCQTAGRAGRSSAQSPADARCRDWRKLQAGTLRGHLKQIAGSIWSVASRRRTRAWRAASGLQRKRAWLSSLTSIACLPNGRWSWRLRAGFGQRQSHAYPYMRTDENLDPCSAAARPPPR